MHSSTICSSVFAINSGDVVRFKDAKSNESPDSSASSRHLPKSPSLSTGPFFAFFDIVVIGAALPAIGLLFARDNNVTSEQAGVK